MLADIFPSTIDELVEDAKCRVTRVENALSGPPSDAVRQPIITVSVIGCLPHRLPAPVAALVHAVAAKSAALGMNHHWDITVHFQQRPSKTRVSDVTRPLQH